MSLSAYGSVLLAIVGLVLVMMLNFLLVFFEVLDPCHTSTVSLLYLLVMLLVLLLVILL